MLGVIYTDGGSDEYYSIAKQGSDGPMGPTGSVAGVTVTGPTNGYVTDISLDENTKQLTVSKSGVVANYLPLTGGVLTGDVVFDNVDTYLYNINNKSIIRPNNGNIITVAGIGSTLGSNGLAFTAVNTS